MASNLAIDDKLLVLAQTVGDIKTKKDTVNQAIKEKMRSFEDLSIAPSEYENAAKIFNECRKKGIQGSQVDFLICSVAEQNNISIFTTDKNFENYSKVISIKLHQVREDI